MATTTLYHLSTGSGDTSGHTKTIRTLEDLTLKDSSLSMENMLNQIKRLERRTFPKDEAMDFDTEIKKRNTELIVIIDASPPVAAVDFTISEANRQPTRSLLGDQREPPVNSSQGTEILEEQHITALVVAYALQVRSGGVSLLHKVCVAEKYRRQGIALQLLSRMKSKLEGQGCERIQLWVDWRRDAAIELYKAAGFRRIDGARDYYGPGRHGVKMALDLTWIW